MMIMLVGSFFAWWYGPGWRNIAGSLRGRVLSVSQAFSARQLLGTIFAPWRRIITYPGAGLPERMRAWGDNLFSRVVGFFIRLFVLLAALIVLVLICLLTLIEIVLWPLLPLAVPALLVAGLV